MDDFTFNGIALAPVVAGVVEILKRYGLQAVYAPLANAILSVGLLALAQTSSGWVGVDVAGFAIKALVLFVASAGVYDLAQHGLKQAIKSRGALPVKNEGEAKDGRSR